MIKKSICDILYVLVGGGSVLIEWNVTWVCICHGVMILMTKRHVLGFMLLKEASLVC